MTLTVLIIILAVGLLILAVISHGAPKSKSKKKVKYQRTRYLDREFVDRKWTTIQGMVSGGGSLRDAVSEADKLLDYALKHNGVPGETMGERMKSARSRFSDNNGVWRAHKLRNALAHEADFDLVPAQAKEAIDDFERGLKDLGAL